jgi:hypothetical protein
MFIAKSRVQGGEDDGGGTVRLWIVADGKKVGSTGVQELKRPYSASQRTISASYLTAGANALMPGDHTVSVYGRADGDFSHLAMVKDLPLIWFD